MGKVGNSRSRAFTVVRAATRWRLLTEQLNKIDPAIPVTKNGEVPVLNEPLLQRISMAKATLARRTSGALTADVDATPEPIPSTFTKDLRAVYMLIISSWLNLLLLAVPLGIASGLLGWSPVNVFLLNFCALIPLALILGDVTEDLALRYGDLVGGLLNATFGNVVEIILSITALMNGLNELVALSLLGSIFSNLLLVLGCCFLVGGIYNKVQSFSTLANRTSSSLLLLASIGMAIPTAAAQFSGGDGMGWVLQVSRGAALLLLVCYACYIFFNLHTHADMVTGNDEEEGQALAENEAHELEEPLLSAPCGFALLTLISGTVAVHSEYLTGSVETFSETTGVTQAFLGMIVLPIAGNACEHLTAVLVAAKNKMDLSLGIAIGSSLQIALLALPLVVVVGWATGHNFSMAMDPFAVLVMVLSVVHVNFTSSDASSHWLMGVSLLAVYVLIALAYAFRPEGASGPHGRLF